MRKLYLYMVKINQNSIPGVSVATITEQGEEFSRGNLLQFVSGLQVSAFSLYSLVYSTNNPTPTTEIGAHYPTVIPCTKLLKQGQHKA